MSVIAGVIFHFIGGFASGSFYMPFRKVKGWNWESFWIIGGLFSWLIIPPIAAALTIPGFWKIIRSTSSSTLIITYLFGFLWGIGGLTYGLGVRYLGVALGSSVILGLCMVFGSLIPALYYDMYPAEGKDTFSSMVSTDWGRTILLGTMVCIAGIIICGMAGTRKEKEIQGEVQDSHGGISGKADYRFSLGMAVAIISGILSACFNFGIEAGQDMAVSASKAWKETAGANGEFLYQNNVVYVVLLWGGLTTNLFWCLLLNYRNRTFSDYVNGNVPLFRNYVFSALAGTTWFLQFFFYGMGESQLGNGPSSWILHMAFIILVANFWGLLTGEWKGVSHVTRGLILFGILTITLAVLIVGYGNGLK